MPTPIRSGPGRIIGWVRDAWVELEYAQRRLFELRTGIPSGATRRCRVRIDELEAWYALEARKPSHRRE
jgi:hypothetical protein